MRRIRTLLLGLLLGAAALPAAGAFSPTDVREHRLDNGLKILLLRDASIPTSLTTPSSGWAPATSGPA